MATILIADDDPMQLEILDNFLSDKGFTTLLATTGSEAESIMAKSSPDLMIIDLIMPEQDGLQTIISINRANSSFAPIIAISTDENYIKDIRHFGAHEALLKPIDLDVLLDKIHLFI